MLGAAVPCLLSEHTSAGLGSTCILTAHLPACCCVSPQVPVQDADGNGAACMCTNALYFLANLPPCEPRPPRLTLPCAPARALRAA